MKPIAVLVFAGAAGLMLTGSASADPCEPSWASLGESGRLWFIYALTTWDSDGDGPESASIIAGGSLPSELLPRTAVARWTGEHWVSLGSGTQWGVEEVTTWDPDGDGPASALLIAATNTDRVMAFDGAIWFPLGGVFEGTNAVLRAMTAWDPDGDGPESELLVIGGTFTSIDGTPIANLAAWDGQAWSALGMDPSPSIRALAVWDNDDDPTTPELLVAGGSRIATFDGTSWSDIDGTPDDFAYALAVWDHDAEGSETASLCAVGNFESTSGAPLTGVARWAGIAWEILSPSPAQPWPLPSTVNALIAGDPDGPGPAPTGLTMITQSAGRECYFWDGTQWNLWTAGMQAPLYAATFGDPDGPGPIGNRVVVGGNFNPGPPAWRDAYGWQPLGSGLVGTASRFALWDPDGDGPEPETVFVGGSISRGTLKGLAMLRDGRWEQIGDGPAPQANPTDQFPSYTLVPWRGGPSTHSDGVLVALAEVIPPSLGLPAESIPLWDGQSWSSIPAPPGGLTGIAAITTWDSDGDGPQTQALIAATAADVFLHDGIAWTSLSTEAASVKSTALVWDPDGAGPATPILISAAASGGYVQRTTGDWSPMPPDFSSSISNLKVTDPDGDGPNAAWLIGARDLGNSQGSEIVRWNGATWDSISSPINTGFYSFIDAWDPDGPGPRTPQPIASAVSIPNDPAFYAAVTYEDDSWRSLGLFEYEDSAAFVRVRSMLGLPHDIPGFPAGSLFTGGFFDAVDGVPSLTTTALRACAPEPCPADINLDGSTTIADFMILVDHFGTPSGATRSQGDLSGDGAVNAADFVILAGDFGCQAAH